MSYAISYSRFSTGVQQRGTSLERQQQQVYAYCEANNLTLLDSFHDAGRSGFSGSNRAEGGQLKVLLDKLQAGDIPVGTHLLIEQTDRLTRELPIDGLSIVQQIISCGITLVTLDDGKSYDRSTDFGNLILLLARLQRGYDESQAKSDRLSFVWAQKAQEMSEGTIPAMRLPYWLYKDDEGKVQVKESDRHLINRILQLSIDGSGGADIAKLLNSEGIRTPLDSSWNSGAITKLIRNKRLIGIHTRKATGDSYNIYPPIVSHELFSQAQSALDSRQRNRGNTAKWSSAIVGLSYCGACGARLKLVGKVHQKYVVCRGYADGSSDCQNSRSMRYKTVLLGTILSILHEAASLIRKRQPSIDIEHEQLQSELVTINLQIERLTQALISLDTDIPELAVQLNESSQRRKDIESLLLRGAPASSASLDALTDSYAAVPDMLVDILGGDKTLANRLNYLLHRIPDMKITLNDGVCSVLGVHFRQHDRFRIAITDNGAIAGLIMKSDDGTTRLGADYFYHQLPREVDLSFASEL